MIALWMTLGVVTQWVCIASLRASDGFRRPGWAGLSLATMVASMACVSVALSLGLSVAVAYGIWTGLGVALAALTGLVVFGDRMDRRQVGGLALVLLGVLALQL